MIRFDCLESMKIEANKTMISSSDDDDDDDWKMSLKLLEKNKWNWCRLSHLFVDFLIKKEKRKFQRRAKRLWPNVSIDRLIIVSFSPTKFFDA